MNERPRRERPLPDRPEQRNDLWRTAKMFDYGPERNLEIWTEAMHMLDAFAEMASNLDNDALQVALVDCHIRAKEEVKRAGSEVRMRREWAEGQPTRAEPL